MSDIVEGILVMMAVGGLIVWLAFFGLWWAQYYHRPLASMAMGLITFGLSLILWMWFVGAALKIYRSIKGGS